MCKKIGWKYDLDEDQGLAGELAGLSAKREWKYPKAWESKWNFLALVLSSLWKHGLKCKSYKCKGAVAWFCYFNWTSGIIFNCENLCAGSMLHGPFDRLAHRRLMATARRRSRAAPATGAHRDGNRRERRLSRFSPLHQRTAERRGSSGRRWWTAVVFEDSTAR
jgi:hypothetical protein